MKRFLCNTLCLTLIILVHAQQDTLSSNQQDTTVRTDTMRTNFPTSPLKSKQSVYKLRPGVDIPVFAIGAGWSAYAFTKIYSKPHSTDEEILNLNKNDINGFDRWAVRPFDEKIDKISYYPFFASMPLP